MELGVGVRRVGRVLEAGIPARGEALHLSGTEA